MITERLKPPFAYILILLFIVLPAAHAVPSFAAEEVSISAEHLEYIFETDTYIAKGSVKVAFEDILLHADEIQYDDNMHEAFAVGNVIYEDADAVITADRFRLNLKTKKGTVYNSYIFYKETNFHIHGKEIKKTGAKTFELDEAGVTTCDSDPPAWRISAGNIKIVQDKSLTGKGGKFFIRNMPVLYTPYFWAPLNKDRQSGLLFPLYGYSNQRGAYYKQGLFWAIKENQDATLYLDYYSKLGLAEGLDYRYILSPESRGELWVYHAKDNEPSRDLTEVKAYHNQELPYDISGYIKIHAVSHFDYYETMDSTSSQRFGLSSSDVNPFRFSSEVGLQKYLESTLHLSKSFDGGRMYILARERQSLEGSSREIPQTLPEIAYVLNTKTKNNFSLNASVMGTNFKRETGQEGFRVDLNPNVYYSYGRLFNITQRIGLRNTSYFLSNPSQSKGILFFDSSTKLTTRFYKKFTKFIHIIEPSLEYAHIPDIDNDDIPFFDSIDSIQETSSINYALTNRLSGISPYYLETRFRISQSYSLLNEDKPFSPLLAEAIFHNNRFDISMNASYDVHDNSLSETIGSIRFNGDKYYVGMGKNFRRTTDLDQYTFEVGFRSPINVMGASLPIDLTGRLWYDISGHGIQDLDIKSRYSRQCWGLSVNFNKKPNNYQIMFAVEFKGLGSFGLGSI